RRGRRQISGLDRHEGPVRLHGAAGTLDRTVHGRSQDLRTTRGGLSCPKCAGCQPVGFGPVLISVSTKLTRSWPRFSTSCSIPAGRNVALPTTSSTGVSALASLKVSRPPASGTTTYGNSWRCQPIDSPGA